MIFKRGIAKIQNCYLERALALSRSVARVSRELRGSSKNCFGISLLIFCHFSFFGRTGAAVEAAEAAAEAEAAEAAEAV